ncbi:MAG: hypothetical protein F6K40_30565 [Okeania sp. SIO3I5]|uniref:hypothetical protein n=1 Tax=Okeania sp. SIO3I5 TaxID=2607805 RepID=UPI0013BBD269|nr:hypothetical protein [Okeania sp. SIO3I5]NEQ40343.1 hypothetical protein [Okeania sp. SIO3I5]
MWEGWGVWEVWEGWEERESRINNFTLIFPCLSIQNPNMHFDEDLKTRYFFHKKTKTFICKYF